MATLTRRCISGGGEKVTFHWRAGLLLIAIVSGSFNWCSSARGIVYQTADATGKEVREFCQLETFRAACRSEDQVLSMVSASYGRMRLGRCVKRDWGYIGCAADVITHLDQMCSGRRSCSFHVADLNGNQPCPGDLAPYLEVVYECVTVVAKPSSKCSAHAPIALTSESGYLASTVAIETGRGGVDCPWRIESLPGQRVNVTLVNFARASLTPSDQPQSTVTVTATRPRICFQLAVIREGSDLSRPVTECEGSKVRNSHVFTSSTNVVEVEMTVARQLNVYFLLHYRIVGCPRPELHPGVWMTLEGDGAVLRCNVTGLQGRIRCLGTRWEGHVVDNCSLPTPTVQSLALNTQPFPFSILIVVSGGVALGVFLGGIVLVFSARTLKRRRRRLEISRSTMSSSSLPFNVCCGRRPRPSYQSDPNGKTIVISCDLVAPMTSDSIVHDQDVDRSCRSSLNYHRCPYSDTQRWNCPRSRSPVEVEETEEDEEEQMEEKVNVGYQSKSNGRTLKRYAGGGPTDRLQLNSRLS